MFGDAGDRAHVAWDIETTGFGWDDRITVTGLWYPAGHVDLIVNTGGGTLDLEACEQHLREASGGVPVTVTVADDEEELLAAMRETVFDRFDRDYNRLVAYNAECWKGGFDLPFLRTRCMQRGVDWVFDGLQFADLWDVVKKRLNTTHTTHGKSVDVNTLTGAHEILFQDAELPTSLREALPGEIPTYQNTAYDPFVDSGSAVSHYRRGDYVPILIHNLADIHRTWELGELIRHYVAGSDISSKRL